MGVDNWGLRTSIKCLISGLSLACGLVTRAVSSRSIIDCLCVWDSLFLSPFTSPTSVLLTPTGRGVDMRRQKPSKTNRSVFSWALTKKKTKKGEGGSGGVGVRWTRKPKCKYTHSYFPCPCVSNSNQSANNCQGDESPPKQKQTILVFLASRAEDKRAGISITKSSAQDREAQREVRTRHARLGKREHSYPSKDYSGSTLLCLFTRLKVLFPVNKRGAQSRYE